MLESSVVICLLFFVCPQMNIFMKQSSSWESNSSSTSLSLSIHKIRPIWVTSDTARSEVHWTWTGINIKMRCTSVGHRWKRSLHIPLLENGWTISVTDSVRNVPGSMVNWWHQKRNLGSKYVYHPSDQMKRNEIGVACGTYGREERCILGSGFETWRGKAVPLQAWTGPEGPRMLRLPDFKTIGKRR